MTLPRESLRDDNHYVLLLPTLDEQFLTRAEIKEFSAALLQEHPDLVDRDLKQYLDPMDQTQRLFSKGCSARSHISQPTAVAT